ncbi:XtrA/YqaO family protein [Bacillus sp. 37MA]|uniref:XtrA/YqaO family protein n=1 Tax=Bacillus sp. 37MA TaxID=1132442 RepID=UPI000377BF15|nr:XtrA/YqaO family protein [Bacillus sp. 37MA]
MAKREIKEVELQDDLSITEQMEPDKVVVIVMDGVYGDVRKFEAAEHGKTVIETSKGKFAKAYWDESTFAR